MTTWHFTHPTKRRYYHVEVVTDLLQCQVIHVSYGSLDSRRGRAFSIPYQSDVELGKQLAAIHKTRAAHGYRASTSFSR